MWNKAGHIKIEHETYLHSKRCDLQLERVEHSNVNTSACFDLMRLSTSFVI